TIKSNIHSLIRPGRIDKVIEVKLCDDLQIKTAIKFHYDVDDNFLVTYDFTDIIVSPAELIKLIQSIEKVDIFIKILLNYKNLYGYDMENLLEQTNYGRTFEDQENNNYENKDCLTNTQITLKKVIPSNFKKNKWRKMSKNTKTKQGIINLMNTKLRK